MAPTEEVAITVSVVTSKVVTVVLLLLVTWAHDPAGSRAMKYGPEPAGMVPRIASDGTSIAVTLAVS